MSYVTSWPQFTNLSDKNSTTCSFYPRRCWEKKIRDTKALWQMQSHVVSIQEMRPALCRVLGECDLSEDRATTGNRDQRTAEVLPGIAAQVQRGLSTASC